MPASTQYEIGNASEINSYGTITHTPDYCVLDLSYSVTPNTSDIIVSVADDDMTVTIQTLNDSSFGISGQATPVTYQVEIYYIAEGGNTYNNAGEKIEFNFVVTEPCIS